MNTIFLAAGAFLAGSIPFGYIIGRLFYRIDIRKAGSGNIGAMNALRTMGKGGAVAVLVLDAVKGFLPVLAANIFLRSAQAAAIAGTMAILGHCFSPWLGWRGGKGVATNFGTIFAIAWPAGLVALGGWLLGALLSTYSSVGSMLGSILAVAAIWIFTQNLWLTGYALFAAALIVYTHRENIVRIRHGRENGISFLRRV